MKSKNRLCDLVAAGVPARRVRVRAAADAQRARDIGIPLEGKPGALNAITDVAGIEVGQVTLISGDGKLKRGEGPVRTGVTAIIPRGKNSISPVFAGWATSNSAGEMTGTTWLEERGYFDGPVMITNTHSVGVVRDAVVGWIVDRKWPGSWFTPVVAETYDGYLNDTDGFHVKSEHALEALEECARRSGGGGQRRRRHRHGLLWIQRRHRHVVARHHDADRDVHGRRARPMQFRSDADAAGCRGQGGRGAARSLHHLHGPAAFAVSHDQSLHARDPRSPATAR